MSQQYHQLSHQIVNTPPLFSKIKLNNKTIPQITKLLLHITRLPFNFFFYLYFTTLIIFVTQIFFLFSCAHLFIYNWTYIIEINEVVFIIWI